jgi:thioredoxin:protein disulfide reductase
MDKELFSDPLVQASLNNFLVLRADVTRNDANDQGLQQHFQVIAPPTMIIFDPKGHELKSKRIIGEISKRDFINKLKEIQLSENHS